MTIELYNTLTRKLEPFKPLEGNTVRMYSCGPTVYSYAHIGNMRSFLFPDLLQRVLRVIGGYDVRWVMNITDIDDKTIRDSAIGASTWKAEMGPQSEDPIDNLRRFTDYYSDAFVNDLRSLGIDPDQMIAMPRATEYIEQMQDLVRRIVANGFGYVREGSVYFDVNAWSAADKYGKLVNIDFDNFQAGVRIDADEYERDQVSDFVLWKARREGEPYWEFEVDGQACPGRPGWHIECSTMEADLLGLPFDIHTGGVDLRFPHHEDEIAQSKAGYGVEPTRFWCHNEFLEVESRKMSKSAGNFFTLRDLMDKGFDPLDIRYHVLAAHHASVFNFTFAGIKACKKARARIQDYIYRLSEGEPGKEAADVAAFRQAVFAHLADNLNTPKAIGEIFSFFKQYQPPRLDADTRAALLDFFREFNDIFAAWEFGPRPEVRLEVPADVQRWAQERIDARKRRDWQEADVLRDKIQAAGFFVKDNAGGYELIKNED